MNFPATLEVRLAKPSPPALPLYQAAELTSILGIQIQDSVGEGQLPTQFSAAVPEAKPPFVVPGKVWKGTFPEKTQIRNSQSKHQQF